ncbi:hypothetical protein DICVIV_06129 [Dictyocaulus viviparus]|uniref:P-type ATPase N-terminal domain-containing protein n=1 Tax=Dictyocaulus viviparus TaxID=29172 RepID=A0A0D8XZL9_DICVI|nr:hypothetical protein DICVIV_06129 [Dictyocaulus viviparus]
MESTEAHLHRILRKKKTNELKRSSGRVNVEWCSESKFCMKVYSDHQQASTSQVPVDNVKGHHRRTSSLWVPPSRPIFSSPTQIIREKAETGGRLLKRHRWTRWLFQNSHVLPEYRIVTPNNQPEPPPRYEHPNRKHLDNRISTTKYSLLTFLPRNLLEQAFLIVHSNQNGIHEECNDAADEMRELKFVYIQTKFSAPSVHKCQL